MSFVLDNSAALAWCFEDEQTPTGMELLDRVSESGASAPPLASLDKDLRKAGIFAGVEILGSAGP